MSVHKFTYVIWGIWGWGVSKSTLRPEYELGALSITVEVYYCTEVSL